MKKNLILIVVSMVLIIFPIVLGVLRINGVILNIQGFTSLSIPIMLFSIGGLLSYIFVMKEATNSVRVLASAFALLSIVMLLILFAISTIDRRVEQEENYTFIIERDAFLFAANEELFVKQNFLFSKSIANCDDGEDMNCSYEVENDILYITECGAHSGTCRTYEYNLND